MHAIWETSKRVYGVEFTAVHIHSQLTALGATMADIPERRSRPGSGYLIPGHVRHHGAFHRSPLDILVGRRHYGVQMRAALRYSNRNLFKLTHYQLGPTLPTAWHGDIAVVLDNVEADARRYS